MRNQSIRKRTLFHAGVGEGVGHFAGRGRDAQVVHVDGMCNECGNCAVFCPYQEGRPYKDKLTLFWSEQDMENSENEGFLAVDEDHFKVRVAGTVRTVSVDAVNTGLPEAVRLTIRAVRDNYPYLLKK